MKAMKRIDLDKGIVTCEGFRLSYTSRGLSEFEIIMSKTFLLQLCCMI